MIRRPPRSTLFPTRRSSDLPSPDRPPVTTTDSESTEFNPLRSEEHTSELQSRQYLVCRLLFEKKYTSEGKWVGTQPRRVSTSNHHTPPPTRRTLTCPTSGSS